MGKESQKAKKRNLRKEDETMNLFILLLFLFVDIICAGAFQFVYKHSNEYSRGMLFGMHIPKEALEHEKVKSQLQAFQKNYKRGNLWNWVVGMLVCFTIFLSLGAFLLLWSIWLCGYLYFAFLLTSGSMRKMYQIKHEEGWSYKAAMDKAYVDTTVAGEVSKKVWAIGWQIPALIGGLAGLIFLFMQKERPDFYVIVLYVSVYSSLYVLAGLQYAFVYHRNKVYSEDGEINIKANVTFKRTWSIVLILTNYLNLCGLFYMDYVIQKYGYFGITDIYIYILFDCLPIFVVLAGAYYSHATIRGILSFDTKAITIDDDYYWKNGWYYNPHDKHLLVEGRMNHANMDFNYARPLAKGFMIGVAAILLGTALLIGYLSIATIHATISVSFLQDEMKIQGPIYATAISYEDIEAIHVINKVEADSYIRTNGLSTDTLAVGNFRGRKVGKVKMYLFTKYKPILEIKTKDEIIFVNSKQKQEIENWYDILIQKEPSIENDSY